MAARREAPFEVVARAVAAGAVPGAVALFGRPEGWSGPRAFGRACLEPEAPMTPATRFDLASLTKVTATLPLALQLIEAGVWRLDEPMTNLLPDYMEARPDEAEWRRAITLRRLLAHTSGIVAWSDLHTGSTGYADTVAKAMQSPLKSEPGERVEYSCLNFILLAEAIRRQLGQPLDQAFAERVAGPLGMGATGFGPLRDPESAAATEARPGGGYWRGAVHDENARAAGGVSGNAGLFGTAEDLARYATAWLTPGALLSAAMLAVAVQNHAPAGNRRGLGWELPGPQSGGSAGDLFSRNSFGHTGFTGTSLWIDPERRAFAILLTNRVHPTRANATHIALRVRYANAVAAALS